MSEYLGAGPAHWRKARPGFADFFAVHLRKAPDALGMNPLNFVGLHRRQPDGAYILVECVPFVDTATQMPGFRWQVYEDHSHAVPLPAYVAEFPIGETYALAQFVPVYDMKRHGGYQNIGSWIEMAARTVGR